MQQRRPYQRYIDYARQQQDSRMGYPLTGAVFGFFNRDKWVKTNNPAQPLIPQSEIGFTNTNAATTMMLNIGDASSSLKDEKQRLSNHIYYPEDIENEVISIFAKHFHADPSNIRGYVGAGGTEGNLAAVWWLRNALINQAKDKITAIKPIILASDQAHYSGAKVAQVLDLEFVKVKSNHNGEIDTAALREIIKQRRARTENQTFIIWLNAGTTVMGAIDNIIDVKKIASDHADASIRIHIDGAILGAALPILKPELCEIFKYTDTISISGHKLLGTPLACGVVLAKSEVLELAFANKDTRVGYVHDIHDITIAGGRSVLPIFQLHLALQKLELTSDCGNFRRMINTCLENANYLATRLIDLIGKQHVTYYPQRFNVIFPLLLLEEDAEALKDKYTLMPLPQNNVCVTAFANVDKRLIDDFIDDYKKLLLNKNEMNFKFKSKL